ncbi:hypothetical protein H4R33_005577 [Dimargaris cristalligena]|nr:hypothetical protein H4R33_005577 [Dimargaris cristalligena]
MQFTTIVAALLAVVATNAVLAAPAVSDTTAEFRGTIEVCIDNNCGPKRIAQSGARDCYQ